MKGREEGGKGMYVCMDVWMDGWINGWMDGRKGRGRLFIVKVSELFCLKIF